MQNVVRQGSKLELSDLKNFKDWEEDMRRLMTQAGVLPAILFETLDELMVALATSYDDAQGGEAKGKVPSDFVM